MQQRGGEEKADDDAEQDQQPVEHPRVGLGAQFAVLGDVFAEKEVERRHGRSGQQEVFGNAEEVDLRQPDQRPVAEEQHEEDVDTVREGQHQTDGEDRHRAGHHRRGDHCTK